MTRDNQSRGKPSPAYRNPDTSESKAMPTPDKQLADVCDQFADVYHYFSQQGMDLPPEIVDEVRLVSKLALTDRIARIKRLNQELMQYLNDAGPGAKFRQ
jgi:hypothetical protein